VTRLWTAAAALTLTGVACAAPAGVEPRPATPAPRRALHVRQVEAQPRPAPTTLAPIHARPARRAHVTSVWDRLAQCESSSRWHLNSGNDHYGGLQFTLQSWRWVGGRGYPHHASKAEQIRRAQLLLARQGWRAWPGCSRKLGLR
jgi:hypothetical protein